MRLSGGFVLILSILVAGHLAKAEEDQDKKWWKNGIFYQLFTRSFMNQGDGANGNFKGIKHKLAYLQELNVTAVILTPIFNSPSDSKYDGFDIEDFHDVNKIYGNLNEFKELVDAAHEKGIKVVLDIEPNHTSKKHYWFMKFLSEDSAKYANFYIKRDLKKGGGYPNNWRSVYNPEAWTKIEPKPKEPKEPKEPKNPEESLKPENATGGNSPASKAEDPEPKEAYLHQFGFDEPDLNFEEEEVKNEISNILKFWLDRGVDGFRINYINHIYEKDYATDEPIEDGVNQVSEYKHLKHTLTKDLEKNYELVKEWRQVLSNYSKEHNVPEKILITEADTTELDKYYESGSDMPLNFDFILSIKNSDSSTILCKNLKDVIDKRLNQSYPVTAYTPNWMLGNRDHSRLATRLPGKSEHMTMIAMMLPGIVVTYYGEEIGMVDNEDAKKPKGNEKEPAKNSEEETIMNYRQYRAPFQWDGENNSGFSTVTPWIPVHKNYVNLNLKKQQADAKSHYKTYIEMIKLRDSKIWSNGTTSVEILNEKVLSVKRHLNEESIVLLSNFDSAAVEVNVAGLHPTAKGAEVLLVSSSSNFNESTVAIDKVKLEGGVSIVLKMKNGAGIIMASINLVLAASLFVIFKLN